MLIAKRDAITITVLSIIFLAASVWALGLYSVPTSTWQPNNGAIFYVDLGSVKNVSAIYILLDQGSVSFMVYTGEPGNWSLKGEVSMDNYYQWGTVLVNTETRYVRFIIQSSYGDIAELAAMDQNGQKIVIQAITGENTEDTGLTKLVDEQGKVECPPTYMSETYFDEIYYVRAAEDYLHSRNVYEWTQPPLGKLIIAAGISIFNFDPFGWRIMGVLFALLMIPVMYFLGKKMFGTWIGAFAPAFLLTLDFMHFTMARIATVDTFLVFFSLLSQFFFFFYFKNVLSHGWKTSTWPLLLGVIFFAFAFSTKWYALAGFLGDMFILLAIVFVTRAKNFRLPFFVLLASLGVAVGIYLLTYIPYLTIGHTLSDLYRLQLSMYDYHSTLIATHPFASPWWSWPLITRPIWFYVSTLPNGIVSTIAAMGNPAVWWVGFASVLMAILVGVQKKNRVCLFFGTIFLFQWLLYAFISRVLFLYAFYSNVPIMVFATTFFINDLWKTRRGKIIVVAYLALVALLFVVFYPVISGVPAPTSWINGLKWLKSWVF